MAWSVLPRPSLREIWLRTGHTAEEPSSAQRLPQLDADGLADDVEEGAAVNGPGELLEGGTWG